MKQKQSKGNSFSLFTSKHLLLLYSLFIGFGSVSFYVFITGVNTAYLGIVWKYSDTYVFNAAIIAFIALLTSLIFFASSWLMIKGRTVYKYCGLCAAFILIIVPFTMFLYGGVMPLSFEYLALLSGPAIVLVILLLSLWKKTD